MKNKEHYNNLLIITIDFITKHHHKFLPAHLFLNSLAYVLLRGVSQNAFKIQMIGFEIDISRLIFMKELNVVH